MTTLDKLYWLYKTEHPIAEPRRGSGLAALFREQRGHQWRLPEGFAPSSEATLSAVGDLINHPYLAGSAACLYADVSDLVFGADLPMANLECPVVPDAADFVFSLKKAPPLSYDGASFDVVKGDGCRRFGFLATACNHSLDFGAEGVDSTIRTLRDEGIVFHGVNEQAEDATTVAVVERNGIRIGLTSLTFGLNAHRPPPQRPWIVNRVALNEGPERADLTLLQRQLDWARSAGVDFVVAQLHWGLEHELYPTPEQVRLAHHLAEMGVDAIVGHHPHVLQPVEWYRTTRDPDRVVPVFYSLGNLVNAFSAPYLRRSGVARLTVSRGTGREGATRTYVREAHVREVVQVADPASRTLRLEARESEVIVTA